MLEAATQLFRVQGLHATGLAEVLEKSGAPRGSLYHYFPGGKEQLAVEALRKDAAMSVVTMSEKGALFLNGTETAEIPAHPISRVIDATGAGDLFAAGVLTGLARGLTLLDSGRLGALAAAEVLSHMGARPQKNLATFAAENGFLQGA